MPCRSDYMDPTPGEHKATNAVNKDLKTLADQITFSSDVLREYILSGQGKILKHVNIPYRKAFDILAKKAKDLYVAADHGLIKHVDDLSQNYNWLNTQVIELDEGNALPSQVKDAMLAEVEKQQVEHRKADIARLVKVFAARQDYAALRVCIDADVTKPLDPQLGFSPDDF